MIYLAQQSTRGDLQVRAIELNCCYRSGLLDSAGAHRSLGFENRC